MQKKRSKRGVLGTGRRKKKYGSGASTSQSGIITIAFGTREEV